MTRLNHERKRVIDLMLSKAFQVFSLWRGLPAQTLPIVMQ